VNCSGSRPETRGQARPRSEKSLMVSFSISPAQMMSFAIVLFRVAGIMIFSPFYSSGAFPPQIKVILPLLAAFMLAPTVPASQLPAEFGLAQVAASVCGEMLIGLVLGLAASFVFGGLQLAGQIMGFQLGFSIINVIDPQSSVETSVISILNNFIGLALFLLVNGHHWFFLAVSDSLQYLPAGGLHLQGPLVEEVLRLSGQVFVSGLRIAGPVIAVTVIADVVLGMIGRAAPQINILIVGMPVKTLVGLASLSLALYFLPTFLGQSFLDLARDLMNLVRSMR
jgi:flagellar biosynthesis protein FliR